MIEIKLERKEVIEAIMRFQPITYSRVFEGGNINHLKYPALVLEEPELQKYWNHSRLELLNDYMLAGLLLELIERGKTR